MEFSEPILSNILNYYCIAGINRHEVVYTANIHIFAHTHIWSLVICILYLSGVGRISPYRCSVESSDFDVVVKIIHYRWHNLNIIIIIMKCGQLASLIAVSLFDANLPGSYGSLINMVCNMLLNIVLSTHKFYSNGGMWNIIAMCWCWVLSPMLLFLV
jgi:hypothetical protein